MSASDISDALITNLAAASVFGACQVATHFGVIETSACCAVIGFGGLQDDPWAMQNQRQTVYEMTVKILVKDTAGNARVLERQLQSLIDAATCSLRQDRTLQGDEDIREMGRISFSHDNENSLDIGGATWYFADGVVQVTEWPSN